MLCWRDIGQDLGRDPARQRRFRNREIPRARHISEDEINDRGALRV